ncbi:MAG: hypothetical protein ABSA97_09455 [Verrucomicrobiia bacterium]
MRPNSLRATLLGAVCLTLVGGCATEYRTTVVESPPPPPVEAEAVVASPGPQYAWIKGHWEWRGRWVWIRGRWVVPPHLYAVWVPGHWARRPRGYVWIPGRWN